MAENRTHDHREYDPEDYFRVFEETANHLNWPVEQWVWLLKPKLSDRQEKDLLKAASLADTYSLIHKSIPNKKAEVFVKPVSGKSQQISDNPKGSDNPKCSYCEKVVVRDLTGISSIPLASVYLDCPLVKGKVELGVIDTELPVKGVSLLLGNDLAGKLIVPNLIVTDTPMEDKVDLEQAPTHIVTRSQAGEKVNDFEVDSDFLAKPILVPHEPFEKLVIDCVGPLPKTKGGNQYLLTLMCPGTRFPEAIPLKNISAKNIAKHLLSFFTTYGIPKDIQTDRGSNFTSKLFSEILKELNIKHSLSSAYHPESQGVLERWHQTFKSMLKKFCLESNLDWDEGVKFLLFAIRESPQESLGVSPFEMVYGRLLRGPLALIKDEWLKPPDSHQTVTVQQYLSNFKETLSKVRKIASENLSKAQIKMKNNYDQKTKIRKFNPGDFVLAYFPILGSPFSSKFFGPYKVVKNVNNHTYVIETPDRRKSTQIIHANLLKRYHSRNTETGYGDKIVNVNVKVKDEKPEVSEPEFIYSWRFVDNDAALKTFENSCQHLSPFQSTELQNLICSYPELYGENPGQCTVLTHDIELLPGTAPIRQHPYRISPAKKLVMKEEVEYLLRTGLAKPSKSPWASPCLLVPREDGSMRLCTDYRRVNSATVKDSYPLPRLDDIIDSVGQAKYVAKIDLLKGYYQGLEGVFAYLDDILVIGDSWKELMTRLNMLFDRLREAQLTINLKKCVFGQATVTYLGHIVGGGNVRPKTANVNAILDYPEPKNRKSLKRFLGMVSYYRKFCRNFASVAAPLHSLTSPKKKYEWDEKCQAAFEHLKYFLSSEPVLHSPNFSKPFSLQVDACDTGAGGVLLQEIDGVLHPIGYTSSSFKLHQLSYSTIEKELLSLVLALQKFECYLQGAPVIHVYTDHTPSPFLSAPRPIISDY
ncbi:uncharacterized protein LOC135199681 [Macrobrachium nipponense]|uniref:uncharacterized protein LOC135199681 n=1 Tax=Macrobrachium nipponense TaxID=159736 RepID=UPI0030C8B459